MEWLVHQTFIERMTYERFSKIVTTFVAIRKVIADSKEEAVGKFMIATSNLTFQERIEPLNCFPFDELATII